MYVCVCVYMCVLCVISIQEDIDTHEDNGVDTTEAFPERLLVDSGNCGNCGNCSPCCCSGRMRTTEP